MIEIPFDLSGKIYRGVMPFSSYDQSHEEWDSLIQNQINLVVLLVEQHEYLKHTKKDLIHSYQTEGIEVLHFPIKDFQIPEDKDGFNKCIEIVIAQADKGKNILVHCLAGLGRTGMFLAILARQRFGYDAQDAIQWIREFIPGAVENPDQEAFVRSI
jgi:protein-tyrosine phosphatase